MSPMKVYANFRVSVHFSGERVLGFRQISNKFITPEWLRTTGIWNPVV